MRTATATATAAATAAATVAATATATGTTTAANRCSPQPLLLAQLRGQSAVAVAGPVPAAVAVAGPVAAAVAVFDALPLPGASFPLPLSRYWRRMRRMNDAVRHLLGRGPGLCTLSLVAGIACSSAEGGKNQSATAGSGGQVSAGGSSSTSSATQATASGGAVNPASTGTAATGGSATGGSAGGTSSTKTGTGGGTASGGAATSGAGAGGTAIGGTSSSKGVTGGSSTTATLGSGGTGIGGSSNTGGANGGSGTTGGTKNGGTGGTSSTGGTGGATTGSGGTSAVADSVRRSTSTYAFKHYPIQTTSDGVWNGPTTPESQVITTNYDTWVLENGFLKVTLLPDYGGRILSIVHKPTNTDLLYQNAIGTPYLMKEGIFYYDYLVIMGGIFASFPEPEHGKYWNQPYTIKVVSESSDAITVRMSRQDDRAVATGVPSKYDVGRTDVLVDVDVTLRAGSASLDVDTKLTNTQNKAVPKFEYWTVTTLAPGSTPGKTAIPLNTRIQAAMAQVHLAVSQWSWFANAETKVSGEIFKWNNLSYFENWQDQGIAYASPNYSANWSGQTNYDNDIGIVRASDNVQTPGLKLWTFGPQGLTADINDPTQWVRPATEMWHGVTAEFWIRGSMAANEVRQWSDSYFPTLGMQEVTAASKYGAMYLSSSKSGTNTVLNVASTLTKPNQTVKAVLRLNGSDVATQDVVVAAADATKVSASVPSSQVPSGAVFQVEFSQGATSLLTGQITLP